MEITEVRIRKINNEKADHLKALISVTFDDVFVVHDIKLVEGPRGMFIAMPSRQVDGKFMDIAHPIKPETRAKIRDAIFREYENILVDN